MKHLICIILVLAFALTSPSQAQDRAAVEAQFQRWLSNEIWPRAQVVGVTRQTFDAAFQGVTLNWKLPDLVPPGSTAALPRMQLQSEFGSPARYFGTSGLRSATATGKEMARRHKMTLANIEKQTGVPGRIILAIWGRESAYGHAKIPHNAFQVLGTKGFMSTRSEYFTDELLAALKIAQEGHVKGVRLKSSWAGALGQPQFMPSNFWKFAADGDGDGRSDIWHSQPDTIASIAAYLSRHGWDASRDWGFEVTVPSSISCALEGPDQGRKIREWEKMGITRVSGRPFPEHERAQEGYLLMPAGRFGPAFVVTPNFYVLKDYNTSDLYALFVGHVGDRIQFGVSDFKGLWQETDKLFRSDIADIQEALVRDGHDVGGVDGLPGYKTRRSIGRWQEKKRQSITCFPTLALKDSL